MPSRVYFFDAITGQEIVCKHTGAQPRRFDAMGASARSGVAYTDTVWSVEVKSHGKVVTLTAADFGDRLVVVKDWCSGTVLDMRMLISEADGFVTLDKVPQAQRTGPSIRDSYGKRHRDHARGTILDNRTALAWIAANRKRAA